MSVAIKLQNVFLSTSIIFKSLVVLALLGVKLQCTEMEEQIKKNGFATTQSQANR